MIFCEASTTEGTEQIARRLCEMGVERIDKLQPWFIQGCLPCLPPPMVSRFPMRKHVHVVSGESSYGFGYEFVDPQLGS
jgi:hypothetical protein